MLLRKLDYYDIGGIANEWFCYYLKKKKQFVSIQNEMSSAKETLTGVPQGSALGRLLFLIYINDLQQKLESYLGVLIDEHLLWNKQVAQIKMLSMLRINANFNILKTVYHSLFESHLQYGTQLWGQKTMKQ